jgi:hypothetical protein
MGSPKDAKIYPKGRREAYPKGYRCVTDRESFRANALAYTSLFDNRLKDMFLS